jgi:hypothetical protein
MCYVWRGSSSYINTSFEDIVDREISALVDLGISPDTDYETFKEKVMKCSALYDTLKLYLYFQSVFAY